MPQVRHGHSNSFGTIGDTYEERLAFWDLVHTHEREKDARTQIRLVLELPHEASPRARQEIVRKFCEYYEEMGVPYWASIHAPTKKNDARNHHAHIVHGVRPAKMVVDPSTGKPAWDFTIVQKYTTSCRHTKTRHPFRQNVAPEFRDRNYVKETRERFAEVTNKVMERNHCSVRYDARSYKDMGLDVEPMKHVARVLADKAKANDFVVLDAEWTRKMIDREMQVAAVERDRTYRQLKKVEKQLADIALEIRRVNKSNQKLPRNMRLSPTSRLTTAAARSISKRMLEAEREKLAQRFVDENTRRTLQHIVDATAPTSAHRGGKARKARATVDPATVPDAEAMGLLHAAAIEELRLHRLQSAGRARKAARKVAAALREWTSSAAPEPPRHDPPPQDPKRPRGPGGFGAGPRTPDQPPPDKPRGPKPMHAPSPAPPTQSTGKPPPQVARPYPPTPQQANSRIPTRPSSIPGIQGLPGLPPLTGRIAAASQRATTVFNNMTLMFGGEAGVDMGEALEAMIAGMAAMSRPPITPAVPGQAPSGPPAAPLPVAAPEVTPEEAATTSAAQPSPSPTTVAREARPSRPDEARPATGSDAAKAFIISMVSPSIPLDEVAPPPSRASAATAIATDTSALEAPTPRLTGADTGQQQARVRPEGRTQNLFDTAPAPAPPGPQSTARTAEDAPGEVAMPAAAPRQQQTNRTRNPTTTAVTQGTPTIAPEEAPKPTRVDRREAWKSRDRSREIPAEKLELGIGSSLRKAEEIRQKPGAELDRTPMPTNMEMPEPEMKVDNKDPKRKFRRRAIITRTIYRTR